MNAFISNYNQFSVKEVSGRYVHNDTIDPILNNYDAAEIGRSVQNRPIHAIDLGNGPIKVLLWSQMHGNESTATKALLDMISYFDLFPSLLARFTLKIIPILNPDGAAAYTRVNANDVDLNRDAIQQTQPESKLLIAAYDAFKPDFCFNLHDQRTIFGVLDQPCMLSFLSPAADKSKRITAPREKAMGIIGHINDALQLYIPNQVGRYDDSYNPNCMGDYFTGQGTPTILFEAGQVGKDYARTETRKWYGFALVEALQCIAADMYVLDEYHNIPEVEKSFVDVLIQNITVNGNKTNVALQYVETLAEGNIHFIPIVHSIGELHSQNAHEILDMYSKNLDLKDDILVDSNAIWLAEMLNLTQYSH